jgi:hypothetical protein
MSEQRVSAPPKPPKIERRFEFHRTQLIGLPLMMIIPILAILGVFGTTMTEVTASSDALLLEVSYPERTRYESYSKMSVWVTNNSDQPLPTLTVSFDAAYFELFSQIGFNPSADAAGDGQYEVELQDVQPGETRLIQVDFQVDESGQYTTQIEASAEGVESAALNINTLVLP